MKHNRTRPLPRFKPHALGLLWAGHTLILLALCDFAARLHAGISAAHVLYIEDFMRSVSVASVLLWGAGLGLEYWERQ